MVWWVTAWPIHPSTAPFPIYPLPDEPGVDAVAGAALRLEELQQVVVQLVHVRVACAMST